jgi:hypothetical protein
LKEKTLGWLSGNRKSYCPTKTAKGLKVACEIDNKEHKTGKFPMNNSK